MVTKFKNTFYGWYVVFGCAMVTLGVSGGQFSFGVFLHPMTEEFGWSRGTLSLAFGITYMISGLLRPLAGYLADRYNAKWASLSGVVIMGFMLALLPLVNTLWQLYLVFSVMSAGITLGTGPILTKIVSQWFLTRRGLTLGITGGAGSMGAMLLVPATSVFLVLLDWREAYLFLGLLLLVVVFPIGAFLIQNQPQDKGLQPYGQAPDGAGGPGAGGSRGSAATQDHVTFGQALRTGFFYRLTFGYFV